ncbi:MAG: DNA-3-methyladenine glycosylase I [Planctomycetota bacterium]|jgi:DNA-3-methyladenine glycosylase I
MYARRALLFMIVTMNRCEWAGEKDELMLRYHDEEWGVPIHDDAVHFEYLVLDSFQAGLSWKTILHRREGFRTAFAQFDVRKVAKFTDTDKARLIQDTGIIRNTLKIDATIKNAISFIAIQKEFGSFDTYVWRFVGEHTQVNEIVTISDYRATSPESEVMSKDLKKRGFSFVGPTICYAYMQAAGLVNDHSVGCFCRNK